VEETSISSFALITRGLINRVRFVSIPLLHSFANQLSVRKSVCYKTRKLTRTQRALVLTDLQMRDSTVTCTTVAHPASD